MYNNIVIITTLKRHTMKIIIDEREISLYNKCIEAKQTYPPDYPSISITKTVLAIGDISILTDDNKDIAIIERKTLADLLASIKDGRYEEQSYRLIHSTKIHPHNIIYLIEGGIFSLDFKERKLIHSIITSINHFKGMTVIKTSNVAESAEFILSFADKVTRNLAKKQMPKYSAFTTVSSAPLLLEKPSITVLASPGDPINGDLPPTTVANESVETTVKCSQEETPIPDATAESYVSVVKKVKKENLTPENIGAVFLSQIPLISSVTANAIMVKYNNSLGNLIEDLKTNPSCLNGIYTEKDGKKRKIGANVVKNVRLFLLGI